MGKYTVQCQRCGKVIHNATKRRKYCSPECRKAAFLDRERALRDEEAAKLERIRAVFPQTAAEIERLIEHHGAKAAIAGLKVASIAMAELSQKAEQAGQEKP